jgi:archaellin
MGAALWLIVAIVVIAAVVAAVIVEEGQGRWQRKASAQRRPSASS